MAAALAALFGLILGSFLNVVIHRVPRRESIVAPASHCPGCGDPLRMSDNLPLLSYLNLKGRCRSCARAISVRYPVVEALGALFFVAAVLRFGLSAETVWALALICFLLSLAVVDLEHRLLPNALVVPGTVAGLALSALRDPGGWWSYPLTAALAFASLLTLALLYPGGLGMGDVKFAALLGAFLGFYAFMAVLLGALLGAVVGGALLAAGRTTRRTPLPFGTFLSAGGLLTAFAGAELWAGYSSLVQRLLFGGGALS